MHLKLLELNKNAGSETSEPDNSNNVVINRLFCSLSQNLP